jgi:hypothetical protein
VTNGYSPGATNPPSQPGRLYRNNGNDTFTDVAQSAGVAQNLNSQTVVWADFDNDGDLDLYVTNAGTLSTGNQPNFLYSNQGNGTFQDVAVPAGATGVLDTGMDGGTAFTDVNADGFLDIIITHGLSVYGQVSGPHEVLRNQGNGANWLQVKLIGQQSNRLGLGARVELRTADGMFQMREMNGGVHTYSQDEMLLAFGLNDRTTVSQLTIYWPSGIVQNLTNLTVNQRLTVTESGASDPTHPDPPPTPPLRQLLSPTHSST